MAPAREAARPAPLGPLATLFVLLVLPGARGRQPGATVRYAGVEPGLPKLTPSAIASGGQGGASNRKPGYRLSVDEADPHDPRPADYEPRPHPDEGGDPWAFGSAHATLLHVLDGVPSGNASAAAAALDAFSGTHSLGLGLGVFGLTIDVAARRALAAVAARSAATDANGASAGGLRALALGAGVCAGPLRILAALGEAPEAGGLATPHELVAVEQEVHLSDVCSQLVGHALGQDSGSRLAKLLPLVPGEDTTLAEVLTTLRDGYELGPFDLVLLEGRSRESQLRQLRALLSERALAAGAVVHAEGPGGHGDAATEALLAAMAGRFDVELREDLWPGTASILATYLGDARAAEL